MRARMIIQLIYIVQARRMTATHCTVEAGLEAEEALEAKHVHGVYSQIATHFSDTRYKPWPRVARFLQQLPPGSLVADVGKTPGIILYYTGI